MDDAGLLTALDGLLRGALVAVLGLLAARWWRDRPRATVAQAGSLLALGLSLATLGTAPAFRTLLGPMGLAPWQGLANGNAVLFALFARALFDDEARWRPWHAAAWLAVTGLAAARCAGGWPLAATAAPWPWPLATSLVNEALGWVPVACAAWVVGEALADWRGDLVERRRWLRWFVAVGGSADMLVTLWLRWHSPHGQLTPGWASADVAVQLVLAATLAGSLLRVRSSELFPAGAPSGQPTAAHDDLPVPADTVPPVEAASGAANEPVASTSPADPHEAADLTLADALARLMAEQRVYREEGLTLAALAQRLAVPEYRLRRVINQRLGHRHFNAYLNGHRLAEARAALADPARRAVPVLTIALDAGFQSIGPFNRAFKAATGRTPTEYRQQALAALAET